MTPEEIKEHFPQLRDGQYCYLDTAATALKPQCMIDALTQVYTHDYATVHRSIYPKAQKATNAFEQVRVKLASWLGADSPEQVIFTKSTTECINLLAQTLALRLRKDAARKKVLVPQTEHHANIVPWQLVARFSPLELLAVKVHANGALDMEDLRNKLDEQTLAVSLAHITNTSGVRHPIEEVADLCRVNGALCLVDGAQGIVSGDIKNLNVDAYCFSAHKLYGPNGVGVLYLSPRLSQELEPFQGGGEMIDRVSFEHTSFSASPLKFEPGTPAIADVIAFSASLDFLEKLDLAREHARLQGLSYELIKQMQSIDGVQLLGYGPHDTTIVNFVVQGVHSLDLATFLGLEQIAVRSGHHCAQVAMQVFGHESSLRVSLGVYNTLQDIERFLASLKKQIIRLS